MSDNTRRQFVIVPIRAVTDNRLPDKALRILCLVCSYCNKEGITWVSQKLLSEDMGVSRPAITRQIILLRELDYQPEKLRVYCDNQERL